MSAITYFLPRRRLSRLVGVLMYWEGPKWWRKWSVHFFAKLYSINESEAEKTFDEYPSIGELFTRKLKSGARPIDETAFAVHPADSKITQWGSIQDNRCIQAKGITYDITSLTRDLRAPEKWGQGGFIVYYLCPTDYHRVHSPVRGIIHSSKVIPGDLWPVNSWSTRAIKSLFCINERVLVEIDTEYGPVGVILVGATNVGQMKLAFDSEVETNQVGLYDEKEKKYDPAIIINKGSELGLFKMGSTVVVLYSKEFWTKFSSQLQTPEVAHVGQKLC